MEISPFRYRGGPVSEELLFAALEFMISLEPDPNVDDYMVAYRANVEKNADSLKMAKAAVRRFGRILNREVLK